MQSSLSRFIDGLEQRAARACCPSRCTATTGRAPATASRRPRRSRPGTASASCRACCATSPTCDTGTSLLGHATCSTPFAVAPTTLQRAAHPDGEVAMAAGGARLGRPDGALQQRRLDRRGHRRDRGGLVAADVRHRRAPHQPPAAPAGRRRGGEGGRADRRHPGRRHQGRRGGPDGLGRRRAGLAACELPTRVRRRGRRREGHRPRPPGHRLARRSRPACRSWSRACSAPTTPAGASRPAPARSGCPTTAGASSTTPSPPPPAWRRWPPRSAPSAEVYVDGGVRTAPARPGGAGPRRARRVPRPAAAVRARRRRARGRANGCSPSSTDELVDVARGSSGCRLRSPGVAGTTVPRAPLSTALTALRM